MHRIIIIIKHCILYTRNNSRGRALTPTTQQQRTATTRKMPSRSKFLPFNLSQSDQINKNIKIHSQPNVKTKPNDGTQNHRSRMGAESREKARKKEWWSWSEMLAVCESRTQWARHKRWRKAKLINICKKFCGRSCCAPSGLSHRMHWLKYSTHYGMRKVVASTLVAVASVHSVCVCVCLLHRHAFRHRPPYAGHLDPESMKKRHTCLLCRKRFWACIPCIPVFTTSYVRFFNSSKTMYEVWTICIQSRLQTNDFRTENRFGHANRTGNAHTIDHRGLGSSEVLCVYMISAENLFEDIGNNRILGNWIHPDRTWTSPRWRIEQKRDEWKQRQTNRSGSVARQFMNF